ncbi:MAG: hypothetical protein ACXQTO_05125, partial [Candidatus Syntropharchaeales archaeon]
EENDKKKYRKKSWVRYERSHSLSAVYMDWCTLTRYATAENAIRLLDEAYHRYIHIAPIMEVITEQSPI